MTYLPDGSFLKANKTIILVSEVMRNCKDSAIEPFVSDRIIAENMKHLLTAFFPIAEKILETVNC